MRGSEPQDGLFGGSATAGLMIERGLGSGLLTERLRVRSSRCRRPLVVINGRFGVLAQVRCSQSAAGVNVEHAQRSEHERR